MKYTQQMCLNYGENVAKVWQQSMEKNGRNQAGQGVLADLIAIANH